MVLLTKTNANTTVLLFEYTRIMVALDRYELLKNISSMLITEKPFMMEDCDGDTLEMDKLDNEFKVTINDTSTLLTNEQFTNLVFKL